MGLNSFGASFNTNVLITEADTSYDGQDIVVSGSILTVDGRHFFNSLLLTNGSVLTHLQQQNSLPLRSESERLGYSK